MHPEIRCDALLRLRGVAADAVFHVGLLAEVGVRQVVLAAPQLILVEGQVERVRVEHVEEAAVHEQAAHTARPGVQVGEPPQHPLGRERHIEAAVQAGGQVAHVGLDELDVADAEVLREPLRAAHVLRRQVHARHAGRVLGKRQRVEPDVALQVRHALAGQVSQLLAYVHVQAVLAALDALLVVAVVVLGQRAPGMPVACDLVHARLLSSRRSGDAA